MTRLGGRYGRGSAVLGCWLGWACSESEPVTRNDPDGAVRSEDRADAGEVRGADATATEDGARAANAAGERAEGGSCGVRVPPAVRASWAMPDPTGARRENTQTYEASSTEVVTDRITGFGWQRHHTPEPLSWEAAQDHCACSSLGGYEDWRLPSRLELLSLVDQTRQDPALDPVVFPGTPFEWFWTSSPLANEPGSAWYIAFFDGNTHASSTASKYWVRCVRGSTGHPAAYVVTPDSVFDPGVGLTWQRSASADRRDWEGARRYCSELTIAGGGFRLPDMKELQTLIDETRTDPAIDPEAFPETPSEGFWTETLLAGVPTAAWFVSFREGIAYNALTQREYRVRCVR